VTDCVIVEDSDSAGEGEGDGSAATALTHAHAIATKNSRVAFINYDYIDSAE
jgi:hypothetical protein